MKLLLTNVFLLVIATGCFAGDYLSVPMSDEQAAMVLVRGNNEFALDLYGEVCSADDTGNVFFSPYSISAALGMTYCGARGETAASMADVLHFSLPAGLVNTGFHRISETLRSGSSVDQESGDGFTLAVSNGLWVQNGYSLLDQYTAAVTSAYEASVENLDFAGDSEGSRNTINSWVSQNTMNRIMNLIPPGVLSADTRLVLTNAVYFKASWIHSFDEYATSEGRFTLADGSVVVVPMMRQTEFFSYGSSNNWSAVSMGYAGGSANMLIILPEGDINEFQEGFDSSMLERIRESLSRQNVQLSMPKFEFTQSMPLSEILIALGMEPAFGQDADFSGITGNRELFITEVMHKAFVKVDETGTEAAAATGVVMAMECIPPTPVEMHINRPFIFLIQDESTGSIVFMGRVMNPAS